MPENNSITKEDLQNAVAELSKLITETAKETAATTEAKLTTEMNKRFRRADRQRKEFRDEMGNRLHEIRAMVINRFDRAEQHAGEAVEKLGRNMTTKLDGIAGVIDNFRTDQ